PGSFLSTNWQASAFGKALNGPIGRTKSTAREHRTGGRPKLCAPPPWLSRRSDASGGLTLNAAPHQADHPAHRATRAAFDLIERTAHTQEVRAGGAVEGRRLQSPSQCAPL